MSVKWVKLLQGHRRVKYYEYKITKVIISKSKTDAQSKAKEAQSTAPAETGKAKTKASKIENKVAAPEKEIRKERTLSSDLTKSHPKKEISSPEKIKSGPKIVGGIKKIFTKKPSGS